MSPSVTEAFGWDPAELIGHELSEFVHPDDRDATLSARSRIIPGHPMRDFENRYLCKDGSFRWLSWSVYPQVDTQQVIGVVRDITEIQLAEQEAARAGLRVVGELTFGLDYAETLLRWRHRFL